MREFIESIINTGNYNLTEMETRIQKMFIMGKLSESDMVDLLALACDHADDNLQIDVAAVLADLETRIARLEAAGVVVWTSGHITKKGETVLYDIIKEGQLRYCRYDGGRATTSLSPGKIDGWVILASAGGAVTHTVQKDENGNIILVPVEDSANE